MNKQIKEAEYKKNFFELSGVEFSNKNKSLLRTKEELNKPAQQMIFELTGEEIEALVTNNLVKTDEEMTEILMRDFTKVSLDEAMKFSLQEMRWRLTASEEMRVLIFHIKRLMDMSNKKEHGEFMEIVNAATYNDIFNTPYAVILKYLEEKRTEMFERRGITEDYFIKCLKEYKGKENKFYKKHFKSKKNINITNTKNI